MGKRKHEDSDKIKRKIRKLQKKLQRHRSIILSSSDEENHDQANLEQCVPNESNNFENGRVSPISLLQEEINVDSQQLGIPCELPDPGPETSTETQVVSVETDICDLDDDILQILGDEPKEELALAKDVHKDIALRWQDILKNGLSKELREKVVSQYLIPANCKYLIAPSLNPEAKAAVSEILVKRDTTIMQKQSQIGIALAALSQVLESIISNETSKQKLLKPLSDACRILCDSHNAETQTRRNIILSSINVNLRDALAGTARDKFLFGEDVSEKLKVAKCVQKTGEALQKVPPKLPAKNNIQARNPRGHLNFKRQHRKTPHRMENERSYRQRMMSYLQPLRAPPPRHTNSPYKRNNQYPPPPLLPPPPPPPLRQQRR